MTMMRDTKVNLALTERVIKGRGSEIKNSDAEGFFLGIHDPVTKSNPSLGTEIKAKSKKDNEHLPVVLHQKNCS